MERKQSYNVNLKSFKSFPRVLKLETRNDYKLSLLFNNGRYRLVDLKELFNEIFKMKPDFFAYRIIQDKKVFEQVIVDGHSVAWPNVTVSRQNFSGETIQMAFDLDPAVLYANSVPDQAKSLNIGALVRRERKKAGLTQQQLAEKTGTNKQYISRLENDKSDVELNTLRKVLEGGLGKALRIEVS